MVDPDPDVSLYRISVTEDANEFFKQVVAAHVELFNEPPEDGEWLYRDASLLSLSAKPEQINAIIQILVDVWYENGLGVPGREYVEFLNDFEITPWDEENIPSQLQKD